MNLHFDPAEFAPLIEAAIEAALRRLLNEQPAMRGKLLHDKKKAAEMLSISASTLDRLVSRGEIRPVKLDGRVLFSQVTLESWIADKIAEEQETAP